MENRFNLDDSTVKQKEMAEVVAWLGEYTCKHVMPEIATPPVSMHASHCMHADHVKTEG